MKFSPLLLFLLLVSFIRSDEGHAEEWSSDSRWVWSEAAALACRQQEKMNNGTTQDIENWIDRIQERLTR